MGGWNTTATQSTVITPSLVCSALQLLHLFVQDFNQFIGDNNLIRLGRPTGSTSYYQIDTADTIYGDIDIQLIAPNVRSSSYGTFVKAWNNRVTEFIQEATPAYISAESTPGHLILIIDPQHLVQVDLMWHTPELAEWAATRTTPQHGIKGSVCGNLYSSFGEVLGLSIQHAGVQYKALSNGKRVLFNARRDATIFTITSNPRTWILDTFLFCALENGVRTPTVPRLLTDYPGTNPHNVQMSDIVNGIVGFSDGLAENKIRLFSEPVANVVLSRFQTKVNADLTSSKRNKAITADAIARADIDKAKLISGLNYVKELFDERQRTF